MSQRDALLDELGIGRLWVLRDRGGIAEAQETPLVRDHEARSAEAQETPLVQAQEARFAEAQMAPFAEAERTPLADSHETSLAQTTDRPLSDRHVPSGRSDLSAEPDRPFVAVESHSPSASADDTGLEGYESLFDETRGEPVHEPAGFAPSEAGGAALPRVAELDFTALKARVKDCTACGLCEKRTQTVFGVGDENADWLIVGEAPGENEDRQGEPFVGQAGKLLDNMLRSLGLDRARNVYIANVIKCRPPGNRDPQPDEVAQCEPFLQRQVALIRPKVIVALGRFAAQTLLKTDATISSLRGRVHEYEGVPVIVSYHPAYLLRSLPDKSKAWTDLCLAQATYRKVTG